jgi:site-specific recombinase XerD
MVVYNRANRLNKRGEGLIHILAYLKKKSVYFTTHVYVKPNQFKDGLVVNHPNAESINYYLGKMKQDIENIELDYFKKGVVPTLPMIKTAVKEHLAPSAKFIDFGVKAVTSSDRKKGTIDGYKTLFNNLQKFKKDVLISDIDYNFIVKYDNWMKDSNIKHNTRIGRLRQLKALMNEALKREIITKNPFDRFKIPNMINKKGYVTEEQLKLIENLDTKHIYVRDAFLFCCYCGLRISDLMTLTSEHIKDGWIHKKMIKTGFEVHIPISKVFDGKAIDIINKYGKIENLINKLGKNNEVNKALKSIFTDTGVPTTYTFHTSRHTFATLLINRGIPITTIQKMLGHTKLATTQIYSEVSTETIENDLIRNIFNAK